MSRGVRRSPPHLAESLLERCLPGGVVGQSIRGDLRQEWEAFTISARRRANRWYWREAVKLCAWYLWRRVHPTSRRVLPSTQRARSPRLGSGIARDVRFALRMPVGLPQPQLANHLDQALGHPGDLFFGVGAADAET